MNDVGKRKFNCTEGDVRRAIAGARKAGIDVGQVEIREGTIIIKAASGVQTPPDELDAELARFSARHGYD